MPTVSVILPVRNGAATLSEAVESILAQRFTDIELLIVDDGSSDASREIANAFMKQDDRVAVLPNDGQGLVDALNTGLRHSWCPYVARMDADDLSLPDRLALQLDLLRSDPYLGVVGCKVERFGGHDAPGMDLYVRWLNSLIDPSEIRAKRYVESPIAHPTALGRREAFAPLYRDMGWPEDYDLWLRVLRVGYEIAKVPEVLLRWRDEPTRLSRTDPRYSPERFRECKLEHMVPDLRLKERPIYLWGLGRSGKPWLRLLVDRGLAPTLAADLHPGRIGTEVHGVPVVHPEEFVRRVRPGDEGIVLIAVAEPESVLEVQRLLRETGYVECRDYVYIA
ncbi:MAG: hypothetical protein AMXMBFR61_17620 [Fimbriimonadales bacterium]